MEEARISAVRVAEAVLLAIAMIRSDAAIEFLLALLGECTPTTAKDVITALALFRSNERVRSRVESVVAQRNEKSVSEIFRQEF